MFLRFPGSIHVERIERVEVHSGHHPIFEKEMHRLFELWADRAGLLPSPATAPARREAPAGAGARRPRLLAAVETAGKVVSLVAGVAVIVFVVLAAVGQVAVAGVAIGNLLTIFGFTLVGGLVSVGGVRLFAVNATLRRAAADVGGCPFVRVLDAPTRLRFQIRSPYEIGRSDFCGGCHLLGKHRQLADSDTTHPTGCTVSPLYRR